MTRYDYRSYESPNGKWHFTILKLAHKSDPSDPSASASSVIFNSRAEGHPGYESEEAANLAARAKIKTLP